MTTSTKISSFEPFLIQNTQQIELSELSLSTILNQVTAKKLVLLRGFNALSREALVSFCQSQASLLSWDFGPVMEMKVEQSAKNYLFTEGDVPLHWDGAFYQEPRFLFFHCLEAPTSGSGGETVFVNSEAVWENCPEIIKREWAEYQLTFSTEKLAHYGGNIQRNLVDNHPETDKTILRFAEPVGENYLNPVHVSVLNKTPLQSSVILAEISTLMRQKSVCYQHQWQTGDYLIADNFSLLHGRNAFNKNSPRHLRRIQIL